MILDSTKKLKSKQRIDMFKSTKNQKLQLKQFHDQEWKDSLMVKHIGPKRIKINTIVYIDKYPVGGKTGTTIFKSVPFDLGMFFSNDETYFNLYLTQEDWSA